jgi:hypothetical protein
LSGDHRPALAGFAERGPIQGWMLEPMQPSDFVTLSTQLPKENRSGANCNTGVTEHSKDGQD